MVEKESWPSVGSARLDRPELAGGAVQVVLGHADVDRDHDAQQSGHEDGPLEDDRRRDEQPHVGEEARVRDGEYPTGGRLRHAHAVRVLDVAGGALLAGVGPVAVASVARLVAPHAPEAPLRVHAELVAGAGPADGALVYVRAAVLGVALVAGGALGARLRTRAVAVRLAALVARRAERLLLVLVRVVVALGALVAQRAAVAGVAGALPVALARAGALALAVAGAKPALGVAHVARLAAGAVVLLRAAHLKDIPN